MKYFRATVSVLNIVVKICQKNSATSPVISPKAGAFLSLEKNETKTGTWISLTSTLVYILHWKCFPWVCLLHPKSKKGMFGSDLPEEMTALEKIKVQDRTSFYCV